MLKKLSNPHFIIAGAAKSGTTSLYYWLKQHPDIFLPQNKEPWFFAFADTKEDASSFNGIRLISDVERYRDLFIDAKDHQITGEASTAYLYFCDETIKNIKKYHEAWAQLKVIIVLRNPIDRAFSHYLDNVRTGVVRGTFSDAISLCLEGKAPKLTDYLAYGNYVGQVKMYKDAFQHLQVYLFEELAIDPQSVIAGIIDMLGIDRSASIDTGLKMNPSGVPKRKWLTDLVVKDNALKRVAQVLVPEMYRKRVGEYLLRQSMDKAIMPVQDRERLRRYYEKEITSLGTLLGRDLSAWLK